MIKRRRLLTSAQRHWLIVLAAKGEVYFTDLRFRESAVALDRLVDLGLARWSLTRERFTITGEGRVMAERARLL